MSDEITLKRQKALRKIQASPNLTKASREFVKELAGLDYVYQFNFLGRPIIQLPQDVISLQEIIWEVRPDLIIETGIAHGGSVMLSAAMLALLEACDAVDKLDSNNSHRKVLAIDIDIRPSNRSAIEAHPLASRIKMIQGSSIDPKVIKQVQEFANEYKCIMVCLDSNHTHDHVMAELKAYAPLTSIGSYCVVFDTNIEDMPADMFPDRPWGPGNSPKTAVWEFLKDHPEFEIDTSIHNKLIITCAPEGYLKRVM
jgi:cephalosporin hydroxylase